MIHKLKLKGFKTIKINSEEVLLNVAITSLRRISEIPRGGKCSRIAKSTLFAMADYYGQNPNKQ